MDDSKRLSRRSTWANMSEHCASLARLDSGSSTSTPPRDDDVSVVEATLSALLSPTRLAGLAAADVAPVPYNRHSFFSYVWAFHGRNLGMLVAPLLALFLWGVGWQLLFFHGVATEDARDLLESMEDLITVLLTPLSFLLTFRLGRAAVRFWDARAAAGKMVEMCRANIATICAGVASPLRFRRRRAKERQHTETQQPLGGSCPYQGDKETQNEQHEKQEESRDDAQALEMLCDYARWLAVFPIAVNHFLRPSKRKGWKPSNRYKKRRYEIGTVLTDEDACNVIMQYDDDAGALTFDAASGTPARTPPLVVLNRLNELAYDIAYFTFMNDPAAHVAPSPQGRAMLYQRVTNQLEILFSTFGAMERCVCFDLSYRPWRYAAMLARL